MNTYYCSYMMSMLDTPKYIKVHANSEEEAKKKALDYAHSVESIPLVWTEEQFNRFRAHFMNHGHDIKVAEVASVVTKTKEQEDSPGPSKLYFSQRLKISSMYSKWLKDGSTDKYRVEDCPLNVVTFLSTMGWLDEEKILEDLKRNGDQDTTITTTTTSGSGTMEVKCKK